MYITTGKQDNFINDLFLNFVCIQLSNIYFKEKNCESILSSVNYFDVFRGETQKSHIPEKTEVLNEFSIIVWFLGYSWIT